MNLSDCINKIVEIKRERAEISAKDKELAQTLNQLESDLMQQMSEAGTYRASSDQGHTVNMTQKTVPTVIDWAEFYKYLAETQNFEFLQKRLSTPAFRDRWESGETVPGVASTQLWDLSVTTKRG